MLARLPKFCLFYLTRQRPGACFKNGLRCVPFADVVWEVPSSTATFGSLFHLSFSNLMVHYWTRHTQAPFQYHVRCKGLPDLQAWTCCITDKVRYNIHKIQVRRRTSAAGRYNPIESRHPFTHQQVWPLRMESKSLQLQLSMSSNVHANAQYCNPGDSASGEVIKFSWYNKGFVLHPGP